MGSYGLYIRSDPRTRGWVETSDRQNDGRGLCHCVHCKPKVLVGEGTLTGHFSLVGQLSLGLSESAVAKPGIALKGNYVKRYRDDYKGFNSECFASTAF